MSGELFMQRAYELAMQAAALNEVPVGAVVVYQGDIIGEGFNRPIHGLDPTAHAEMIALREAAGRRRNYRLEGCDLFVTLEPCPMCAGAMVHARIRRLLYAAKDLKTGACGGAIDLINHPSHNHAIEVHRGLMEEQCAQLLIRFFRTLRNSSRALSTPD